MAEPTPEAHKAVLDALREELRGLRADILTRLHRIATEDAKRVAEVDRLRADLSRLVDAYIHEQTHPERKPGYRYRATLAIGFETWTDDLDEARRKVRRAAGVEP
jgi:anti-sigma factor RsiW